MRRLALATVLAALVPASAASAHAVLVRSAPRESQAVSAAPGGVALRFDEPVSVPPHAVRVLAADGRDVAADVPVSGMAAVVRARVPRRLAAGKYTVRWRVVADDGHTVSGSYRFKVRPGARMASAPMPSMGGAASHGGGAPATQTILLIAALAAIAIVALRGSPLGGREAGEARAAVTVDAALIAVGAFCALALIGVVAANQDAGGSEQVAAASAPAPVASPAAAPTRLSSAPTRLSSP